MEAPTKSLTLVLGGARSGKSRFAQELAAGFDRVTFLATARGSDAEMRRKIADHRRTRPADWKTVEAPKNLAAAIRSEGATADLLLIDCLTVYLDNALGAKAGARKDLGKHFQEIREAIRSAPASVIAVSNEVGNGVVPPYRSGRLYRDILGQLNQQMAEMADLVILMVAGIPVTIKERQMRGAKDAAR